MVGGRSKINNGQDVMTALPTFSFPTSVVSKTALDLDKHWYSV
jgi:hypothetical protein